MQSCTNVLPVSCGATSSVCSLLGLCCPAQPLALWNFILKLWKLLVGLADWSQVCVLLPKTPSCTPALPFWGAAKNQLGFIVCREHVVWFSCADPGAGRGQGGAPRGGFVGPGAFQDGINQSPGLYWVAGSPGRLQAQVLLSLCGCGLTNSCVCCAIPHCPRPEWGGIFALWFNSSALFSMPGAPGLLLGSVMGAHAVIKIMRVMGRGRGTRWLLWKWFPQKFCICLADNSPCAVVLSPGLLELEFCWWSTLVDF